MHISVADLMLRAVTARRLVRQVRELRRFCVAFGLPTSADDAAVLVQPIMDAIASDPARLKRGPRVVLSLIDSQIGLAPGNLLVVEA